MVSSESHNNVAALNVQEAENTEEEMLIHSQRSIDSINARAHATENQIFFNIVTGGLGTGILTIPWMVAGASMIPSVLATAGVLSLNVWSLGLLVELAEAKQEFNLGRLLRLVGGTPGLILNRTYDLFCFSALFGVLIGYIMAISSNIADLWGAASDSGESGVSYPVLCMMISVIVMPVCFFDQAKLSYTSVGANVIFTYMLVVVVYDFANRGISEDACALGYGKGTGAFLGGVANAVIIQMCILPMYAELKDRSPKKMKRAISKGFGVLFVLFIGFGLSGYMAYGPHVRDIITLSMAESTGRALHVTVGQVAFSVALIGCYPVMLYGAMTPLYTLPDHIKRHYKIIKVVVVLSSAGLAIPLQGKLGTLNNVSGALQSFFMCCGVPAVIGWSIGGKSPVGMAILVVMGVVFGIIGLLWTDNFVDDLQCID